MHAWAGLAGCLGAANQPAVLFQHGAVAAVHWCGQLQCQRPGQLQQQVVVQVLTTVGGEEGRAAWLMVA